MGEILPRFSLDVESMPPLIQSVYELTVC